MSITGTGEDAAGRHLFEVLSELQRCIEPALSALRADNVVQVSFPAMAMADVNAVVASSIQDELSRPHAVARHAAACLIPASGPASALEGTVATPAAVEARGARHATAKEVKFEMEGPDELRPQDDTQRRSFEADAPSSARSSPGIRSPHKTHSTVMQITSSSFGSRPVIGQSMAVGRASRCSEPVRVAAPLRALVINVRKLVEAQERMGILHDLIKSTAIAALTLVNASSEETLRCTGWFLLSVILIFLLHHGRWDLLEIGDFRLLLPMLSDDEDGGIVNPNRLLKAMSVMEWRCWKLIYAIVHAVGLFVATFSWLIVANWWEFFRDGDKTDGDPLLVDTIVDRWRQWFVVTEEDGMVLGMQVSVASLMFLLHIIFEAYHYQETCSVMPRTPQKGIWDPRVDGVPLRYRLFGLPGLWFTSKEALDDFKHWVDSANGTRAVADIYPQEMAQYALCGSAERQEVQLALKYSKLFDGRTREFVDRQGRGPQELDIELTFFDEAVQNKECPFPGEFLTIVDNEDEELDNDDDAETGGPATSARWQARQALGMMRGR